jgi:ABC-type bacteriocin/lantibiotic exporter with double-glycine peptidase domain
MKILDFPRVRQSYDHDCGAKALQAILVYYGIEVRIDKLMKLTKSTDDGTSIPNILDVVNYYGLKSDSRIMTINDVVSYIDGNIPVMVPLQAWPKTEVIDWKDVWDDGHYVDAIGYDSERLIFMDPSNFNRTSLSYDHLLERWHDIGPDGTRYIHHGIAIFGKEPEYKSFRIIPMD